MSVIEKSRGEPETGESIDVTFLGGNATDVPNTDVPNTEGYLYLNPVVYS